METLPFCPQPGYTTDNEPRRKTHDFGDGYQQRRADGLNPLQRKFSVSFNLPHEQAVILDRFFTNHGGVRAFQFKEKESGRLVKVVCPKWSKTTNKRHTKFQCEFEEVI